MEDEVRLTIFGDDLDVIVDVLEESSITMLLIIIML